MHKRFFSGRGILIPAGLALMLVSAWEVSIRLDAMLPPIRMFFSMARGEGISFSAAMSYFDWGMFALPLYLILCTLTGLLALFTPGRKSASAVLTILSAVLAAVGLGRETGALTGPWYLIQPALLLLLAVSGAFSLAVHQPRQKRMKGSAERSIPADVPRLNDAPRLRSIRTGVPERRSHTR